MADGDLASVAGPLLESVHSFSVSDYHRMAEAGILSGAGRVELIEGVVVRMSPIGPKHFAVTLRLDPLLRAAVAGRATVSVQGPIRMAPRSEPEPDLAVLRPRPDDYEGGLPVPADVLLLVEVADTTLARDRDVKAPLYARHNVPEFWLFDVGAREVLVHRCPVPDEGRYRRVERAGVGAMLMVEALPGAAVTVADVFGAGPAMSGA